MVTGNKVGIGTASPTSKLSITDSATMYAALEGVFLDVKRNASNGNDTTSRAGLRLGNNSNGFSIFYGGTTDRLRFIDGGNIEVLSLVNGGNVGIGTTSPDTKLEIVGADPILTIRDSSTSLASAKAFLRLAESGANDTLNRYVQVALSGSALGTNLTFDLDGSEKMRINESGNVGIGTTSPATKLSVGSENHISPQDTDRILAWYTPNTEVGNSSHALTIGFDNNATDHPRNVGLSLFNNSTTANTFSPALTFGGLSTSGNYMNGAAAIAAQLPANANDDNFRGGNLIFYTQGTTLGTRGLSEKMRISANGNVGIGTTTSPGSKLEVAGTIDVNTADTGLPTIKLSHTNTSADNFEIKAGISGVTNGGFSIRDVDAAVNRFVIDSNGNVGIGTSSPSGIGNVTLELFETTDTQLVLGNSNNFVTLFNGVTVNDPASIFSNTGFKFAIADDKNATNFSEKMRIDTSGRLFLGTATVAAANAAADDFVIKGEGTAVGMTISNSSDAGTGTIFFGDSTDSAAAGFRYNHNTGDMAISAEDNITITADRVGIGVLSPDDKLHVGGNIFITDSSPEITLETTSATHFNWQIAAQENVDGALEFSVGSQDADASNDTFSPLMVIKNDGKIGIGVDNPDNKLEVDGSSLFKGLVTVTDDIFPEQNYVSNIGSINKKFLTLHVAELVAETLVASERRATVGGRFNVGIATQLSASLNNSATTIYVKHNNLNNGDIIHLEGDNTGTPKVEFMSVDSGATTVGDGFSYTVTRDLDNSGGNEWDAGSGVFNTGQIDSGFIDQYAINSLTTGASTAGPTIAFMERTGSAYQDIDIRTGVGNLKGWYGYSTDKFGFAAGDYKNQNITVDESNGLRIRSGSDIQLHASSSRLSIGDSFLYDSLNGILYVSGSNIQLVTPTFFLGGENQYVSGSNGNIEISGSNFHLLNGNITASNVDLSGKITATSGEIGGFGISQDAIFGDNFYLSGSATGNQFFISSSKFNIKANGDVTGSQVLFTGGDIGGFSISQDALSGGNFYLSGSATGNEFFISSSKFNVKANGDVTASNADITGKISATSGEIGGWTINDGDLSSTNITLSSDNESIALGSPTPGNLTSDGIFLSGSGEFNFQVVDFENDKEYIRQSGGVLDVRASKFFIGNETTQFISGANSNIEISSSLFHLDPQNSTLIIGADAVINADVTANSIRTPATIGGAPSTVANASSSIDSNGFAKFVSASIGGWNVTSEAIYKEVGDVFNILGKPDNITGAWSTTWENGLTVGKNGANRLWISGDETGNHYEMAIYSASQYLVRLGTNENKIAGWTIDNDSIFSGTKDTSEYSTSGITLSSAGSIHTPSFYVSTAGDAFFKGTLSAPDGNIGGFTIANSQLHTLNKSTFTSNEAGVYIGTDGIALGTNSPFNVNANGEVTASNFLFEGGKITGDVSFQAPLDGSTVVYFDDFSIYPTVTDVTSSGDAPKIDGSGQGYYPFQNNGELSLETGEGELFGKAFKIGNNTGNDYSWFSGNRLIPFNENSLYEMEIRIKETAGIGTHYAGIAAYSKNGTTKVNSGGANSHSSQYYFVLSNASIGTEFTTYRGYFKGTSSSGNGGLHNSKDDPGTVHVNALNGYFTPMFIAQYQNDPGITYVDYIKITEFNVGGSSTVISGNTIKTGTIKSTNLTATLGTQLALDDGEMRIGGTGAYTSNNGILLDGPNSRFAVGNAGGSYIRFNHTDDKIEINTDNFDIDSSGNVTVTGTVNANAGNFTSTITIGDGSTTGTLEVGTGDSSIKIDGTNSTSTTKIYAGAGNFNNTDTGFFIDAQGRFSLRDKLSVNTAGELGLSGSVNSTNGNIGGWTISDTAITSPNDDLVLDSSKGALEIFNASDTLDLTVRAGNLSTNTTSSVNFSTSGQWIKQSYSITNSTDAPNGETFYRYLGQFQLSDVGSYTALGVTANTCPSTNPPTSNITDADGFTSLEPLNPVYLSKIGYKIYTGYGGLTTPSGTQIFTREIANGSWEDGDSTNAVCGTSVDSITIENTSANTTYYIYGYLYHEGIVSSGELGLDAYIASFSDTFDKNSDIVELTGGGIQVASSANRFVRIPQTVSDWNLDIAGKVRLKQTADTAGGGLRFVESDDDNDYWDWYMGGGDHLYFKYATSPSYNGRIVTSNTSVTMNFTGQHRSFPEESQLFDDSSVGLIVSSTGTYYNIDNTTTPTVNESLPRTKLTSKAKDKAVFGVITDTQDKEDGVRVYTQGVFQSAAQTPEEDEDRIVVNSVGEGGVWVSNYSGSLENGDYITSSPIPGIGMKQDDDLLHNYTVAKITQDCYFNDSSKYIEVEFSGSTYRKQFVGCTYHCG